jgi:hypothetical protein
MGICVGWEHVRDQREDKYELWVLKDVPVYIKGLDLLLQAFCDLASISLLSPFSQGNDIHNNNTSPT